MNIVFYLFSILFNFSFNTSISSNILYELLNITDESKIKILLFFPAFILGITLDAVSYTHLDVYKRQDL